MSRATTLVLFLATALLAGAQTSSVDADKLAQIRSMSPEERAKLKARLDEIKKLTPDERERLKENLKKIKSMAPEEVKKATERAAKLSAQDHKELTELAGGFFKWIKAMGHQEAFPRVVFFQWLKREHPGKLEEIRQMEPGPGSPRVDEFIRLYPEFRTAMYTRTEEHVRKHKCFPMSEVQALKDLPAKEFWPRWQEMTRGCAGRKAVPGPVPPRPIETPKK